MVVELNRLNPGLLQTFLAVADAGRVSGAARRLHLSQPAITAQIRKLEVDLDTPLFIRSVHGVTLNPRGVRLRERLQHVFAELEQVFNEVSQTQQLSGVVRLAASTTSAAHFVPRIFAGFRRYHPDTGLNLIVGNAQEVLEHVREHRVALGLLGSHQRIPGVRLEPFMPDEIVAVCAAQLSDPKFRRAIDAVSSVRDLERLTLVWREPGAGTRAIVEKVLKNAGLNVRNLEGQFEQGSTEAIKSLVGAGVGIAFFSCLEIQKELSMGLLRQVNIPGLRIHRMFSWALPTGELGGLPGEFYRFVNSIQPELSAVSLKRWD
jgi:DNA-binding transcriptional LysR family regulator